MRSHILTIIYMYDFQSFNPSNVQFLRLSWDTPPSMVYTLMTAHWGLPAPNLVVSIVGGEGRTKVKTWVREVLRQGLVKASQSTGKHMMKAKVGRRLHAS